MQGGATVCVEYQSAALTAEAVRMTCSLQMGATYSASACASANRVGRCTVTSGAGVAMITQVQSYYAPISAADAMMTCSRQMGTWAAN